MTLGEKQINGLSSGKHGNMLSNENKLFQYSYGKGLSYSYRNELSYGHGFSYMNMERAFLQKLALRKRAFLQKLTFVHEYENGFFI